LISSRLEFLVRRLRERLWVKPLGYCLLAVLGALVAHAADFTEMASYIPQISTDTVETLLAIISSTMLAVATFAVASMISAYASASGSATPRAFTLVVADDMSQVALSVFVGAFIFSIVATIALRTGYYGKSGRFILFLLTLFIFSAVILTFVRWVDSIARLGRMGTTIETVELAARNALQRRRLNPTLGGRTANEAGTEGTPIYASDIGYVQHIDMETLQGIAEAVDARITVSCLPGAFTSPGKPVAFLSGEGDELQDEVRDKISHAFLIADQRSFDEDPRFGLIVLSEIAARALSPAVNDPGTAIAIIGTIVRLFAGWIQPLSDEERSEIRFDNVYVPELSLAELFTDAFTSIARDGAGNVEVCVRLQKAFLGLIHLDNSSLSEIARGHSKTALARAQQTLTLDADVNVVEAIAAKVAADG
tara:strand:+ start:975 stop:2243 length:1269 start_codon:yes stop_codon:yes gene_type:complete